MVCTAEIGQIRLLVDYRTILKITRHKGRLQVMLDVAALAVQGGHGLTLLSEPTRGPGALRVTRTHHFASRALHVTPQPPPHTLDRHLDAA
jgi:hypothetical protein